MIRKKLKFIYFLMGVVFLFLFSGHLYAAHTTVVKGDTIKAIVRAYVSKNMPWLKGTVRVEFPVKVSDLKLAGEKITCRIRSNRNEDFIGNSVFAVRFYEEGVFLREKTVRARLDVLMDVVVSTKSLPRNTRINRDDVILIKKWLDRIPLNIISNMEGVVGKRLRTSVKPNAEITRNMVRSIPMVKRGKLVRIVLENDSMRITTIGLSEQDGMLGDIIRVKNVSSRKTVYARVMGNSLVRVEF
ncbi:MAG: flagellar basal body P-ring formation protein FlgA [Proteobacteria bacterium]|nr:flagellar basal body P-ring formation protein FlgA [Pseudomonadota bacterium]